MPDDRCFYCREDISEGEPVTQGRDVLAHERCVDARLVEQLGANWREVHCDGDGQRLAAVMKARATRRRNREMADG